MVQNGRYELIIPESFPAIERSLVEQMRYVVMTNRINGLIVLRDQTSNEELKGSIGMK